MNLRLERLIDSVVLPLVLTLGLAAMIFGTTIPQNTSLAFELHEIEAAVAVVMVADLIWRFWNSAEDWHVDKRLRWHDRWAYLRSAEGVIDIVAATAVPVGLLVTPDLHDGYLFAAVW